MFIPRINLDAVATPHAKWLEDRMVELIEWRTAVDRSLAKSSKSDSVVSSQLAAVNKRSQTALSSTGLPDGGKVTQVVRKTRDGAIWSSETLQHIAQYTVNLSASDPWVFAYAGDGNEGYEDVVIPIPTFFDNGTGVGTGMNPILTDDGDQIPANILLQLNPESDLEEFFVYLPTSGNSAGGTAAFWTLTVVNQSSTNRAVLQIGDAQLVYAGTNVPVNGDEESWELRTGYVGSWFVMNNGYDAGVSAATPLTVTTNSSAHNNATPFVRDEFYTTSVQGRSHCYAFDWDGTVGTGVHKRRYRNDTATVQFISLASATVGTAPTGSAIEVDVLVDGVSILATPLSVAAAATSGTVTPDAIDWPWDALSPETTLEVFAWEPGSVLTVEVTAVGSTTPGSDMTVQVWAG